MEAYEELRMETITFERESDIITASGGDGGIQFPISDG